MVKTPGPDDEDGSRICGEVLIAERVRHVNRARVCSSPQGVTGYQPLRKDCGLHKVRDGDFTESRTKVASDLDRFFVSTDLAICPRILSEDMMPRRNP